MGKVGTCGLQSARRHNGNCTQDVSWSWTRGVALLLRARCDSTIKKSFAVCQGVACSSPRSQLQFVKESPAVHQGIASSSARSRQQFFKELLQFAMESPPDWAIVTDVFAKGCEEFMAAVADVVADV